MCCPCLGDTAALCNVSERINTCPGLGKSSAAGAALSLLLPPARWPGRVCRHEWGWTWCPSSPEPGCAPGGLQEEGRGHSPSPGSGGSCSPWQWGRAAHRVTPSQAVLPASGPSPQLGAQARRAASGWQCPGSTGSHPRVRDFYL